MPDTMLTPDKGCGPDVVPAYYPDRSGELDQLAAALAKAQAEIEGAVKDKNNPAFRSKYADLGAVWDAIREPLTKHQLSVVQFPRRTPTGVAVKTMLLHASGQWISGELEIPCAKQDAHGVGSATTYARRFSLSAVVGVAPMDDDGNAAAGKNGFGSNPKDYADEAHRDGLTTDTRSTYEVNKAKAAATKAREWTTARIQELNEGKWTRDELEAWWDKHNTPAKANQPGPIDWVKDNFPAEYERFEHCYLNAEASCR